jgi:AraC-like DNA-binding protein
MSTTSIKFVSPLLEHLQLKGIPIESLLSSVGIPTDVGHAEHPINWEQLHQLWNLASRHSEDPLLGLHVGMRVEPHSIGVLGQALSNANTLEHAYTLFQRYGRLVYDEPLVELVSDGEEAALRVVRDSNIDPEQVRPLIEFLVASLLHIAGALMGGSQRGNQFLKRVEFRHTAAVSESHYRRICQAPEVSFSGNYNALVFDIAAFQQPVVWADQKRLAEITASADLALRKLATERDIVARVRAAITRRLLGKAPTLVKIAEDCAMSRATLQRKLALQNTNFQAQLDDVRLEIAADMLADRRNRITDIALILGYSETAAFDHAYKRWTGSTPQQNRANRSI